MNDKTQKVLPELEHTPFYIEVNMNSGATHFSQQQSAADLLNQFEKNFRMENPDDELDYDAVFNHIYDYLSKLKDGLDKGIKNLDFFNFEGKSEHCFFNPSRIECIVLHNLVAFSEDLLKLAEFHDCD